MKTENTVLSALFIATGVLLPFIASHGFGVQGTMLLPMHIPVFLSGLLLGWKSGLLVGIITPVISCVLTGMPPAYPMLPIMVCELATYGFVSGLLFRRYNIYITLVIAMLCGRISYSAVYYLLLINNPELKALSAIGAITAGIVGIVIQIAVIPPLVLAIQDKNKTSIRKQKFDCIINTANGKKIELNGNGVKPLLQVPIEELKNAKVYDKVIGKAVAIICVLGGVRNVYGKVMSKPAEKYLKKHGITYSYDVLVKNIQNRTGDGICPIEACVMDIDDPNEGFNAIQKMIKQLNSIA